MGVVGGRGHTSSELAKYRDVHANRGPCCVYVQYRLRLPLMNCVEELLCFSDASRLCFLPLHAL